MTRKLGAGAGGTRDRAGAVCSKSDWQRRAEERGGDAGAEVVARVPDAGDGLPGRYHSQLNDRYAAKRDEYQRTGRCWRTDRLLQSGVGIGQPTRFRRQRHPRAGAAGRDAARPGHTYVQVGVDERERRGRSAERADGDRQSRAGHVARCRPVNRAGECGGVERVRGRGAGDDDAAERDAVCHGRAWLQPARLLRAGARPGAGRSRAICVAVPRIYRGANDG